MRELDPIVAAATPWGRSAIGVLRLSGRDLTPVLCQICTPGSGWPVPPGRPRRVCFHDGGGAFDDGVVVLGRAPSTYTGEDTAELSCHGNPRVVRRLLEAAILAGARLAEPGEFTRRAYLNGKVDLVQAEAVDQLICATSDAGLQVAMAGLDGRLGARLEGLRERLLGVAAELEARLDYPADDLTLSDDDAVLDELRSIGEDAGALADQASVGRVLVHGARVALVGPVNAGKSSLFNALLGRRRALVHELPGTTRDVLEVVTDFGGLTVTLLDTAGERETDDPIEVAGLALGRELVAEVDLVVLVLRARPGGPDAAEAELLRRVRETPCLVVYNGVDRPEAAPPPPGALPTVAIAEQGIMELRHAITAALLGGRVRADEVLVGSARQQDLLRAVRRAAMEGAEALVPAGPAVAAEAVMEGIAEIDALTGADTREAVLDALFARFCIGK